MRSINATIVAVALSCLCGIATKADNTSRADRARTLELELSNLPAVSASLSKLERINWRVVDLGMSDERDRLLKMVAEKYRMITAASRSAFVDSAKIAATKHSKAIGDIGVPTIVLDATIFFDEPTEADRKFMTIRNWMALLLEQGIQAGWMEGRGLHGIALKRPGQRTMILGFQIDGGDAFLTVIGIGDAAERIDTPLKQIQGKQIILESVKASMW